MKKNGSQNLEVKNVQLDHSYFEAEKTGNEYLYQLNPLLTLLQSDLVHCKVDRLFDEYVFCQILKNL